MAEPNVAAKRAKLEGVISVLDAAKTRSYATCVRLAVTAFHNLFFLNIRQLLYNFPRDHVTSSGALFWSGDKRAPAPVRFNPEDDLHMGFVVAAAHVAADSLCIKLPAGACWSVDCYCVWCIVHVLGARCWGECVRCGPSPRVDMCVTLARLWSNRWHRR